MNPKSILITGANRGLGFEMVRQVLAKYQANFIFATYRTEDTAKELFQLASENKNVFPVRMDVTDPETFPEVVQTLEKAVGDRGLQLLINNAGIFLRDGQSLELISKNTMLAYFEVNMFAALFVTQAFLPLLEKARNPLFSKGSMSWANAGVINFSSRLGSISDNKSGGYYASRCTRTALNSATKSMSIDLKDRCIFAVGINPGWVQTDQGGSNAPLTPVESVKGILNVMDELTLEKNGQCLQYDGQIVPL